MNISKCFKAMEMQYERDIERLNFLASRKLNSADYMQPKTAWRYLDDSLLVDIPKKPGAGKIEPGSGSHEKKKQTLREQSILKALYIHRNMVPDSPEEPDQMEKVNVLPHSEPINIPLEDVSGEKAYNYNYVDNAWPEPKGYLRPVIELPMEMPLPIMMQQPQFPVYGGNQMYSGMAPENVMPMGFSPNNMYIPNQIMMNNQIYLGNQMFQPLFAMPPLHQPPPQLHPPPPVQDVQWIVPPGLPMQHWGQQQPPPQHHPPLPVQDVQRMGLPGLPMQHDQRWGLQQPPPQHHPPLPVQDVQQMGPPRLPMQHDQHWGQQQPPPNSGPPHFEMPSVKDLTPPDSPKSGIYNLYRGKMICNNQRSYGGSPYNRIGGYPGNGRGGGRLC